jgi:hypothetical protein
MNRINNSHSTRHSPQAARTESRWNVAFELAKTVTTIGLIVIHECGHAVAATFLFKNANPQIKVNYPFDAFCSYNSTTLSSLGRSFGEKHSIALVAGAGPITEILSILAITKLSNSSEKVAQLMSLKAISLSVYAISGLWSNNPMHDFSSIWKNSGKLAYGLITACCLATTALVLRNGTKSLNKGERSATDPIAMRRHQTRRIVRPLHRTYDCQSESVRGNSPLNFLMSSTT